MVNYFNFSTKLIVGFSKLLALELLADKCGRVVKRKWIFGY